MLMIWNIHVYRILEKSVLIDIIKYDFIGQYLSINVLIFIIVNKISSTEMKMQYINIYKENKYRIFSII